ncbi:hypothetical protein H0H81_007543, partial [Sphagnurus paluster]
MPSLKSHRRKSAAHAREAKLQKRKAAKSLAMIPDDAEQFPPPEIDLTGESDSEGGCDWDGTVNHYFFETDSDYSCSGEDSDSDDGFSEFDDEELLQALSHEAELLNQTTPYEALVKNSVTADWRKVEKKFTSGCHTGSSVRTQQRKDKKARDKEKVDEKLRKSNGAVMLRGYFAPKPKPVSDVPTRSAHSEPPAREKSLTPADPALPLEPNFEPVFTGYASDLSGGISEDSENESEEGNNLPNNPRNAAVPSRSCSPSPIPGDDHPMFRVRPPPPPKRRRLEIPARIARQMAQEERRKELA